MISGRTWPSGPPKAGRPVLRDIREKSRRRHLQDHPRSRVVTASFLKAPRLARGRETRHCRPPGNHERRNPALAGQVCWRLFETMSARHPSNAFVIRRVGSSRTIAYNQTKTAVLLSTLIEACASQRRGLAISNEEQSDV